MAGLKRALLALVFAAIPVRAQSTNDAISVAISGELAEWNTFNSPTPASKEASLKSHEEACRKWKAETRRLMGDKLKFLECGKPHGYHVGAAMYDSSSNRTPYSIGNLDHSTGTILVNIPPGFQLAHLDRKVEGDSEKFTVNDFPGMLSAFAKAKASFDGACAKWQAEVEKDFDKSFVVAICGDAHDAFFVLLRTDPKESWRARFYFYSTGGIYYFKAKE
jgi:hypothetical protein